MKAITKKRRHKLYKTEIPFNYRTVFMLLASPSESSPNTSCDTQMTSDLTSFIHDNEFPDLSYSFVLSDLGGGGGALSLHAIEQLKE